MWRWQKLLEVDDSFTLGVYLTYPAALLQKVQYNLSQTHCET